MYKADNIINANLMVTVSVIAIVRVSVTSVIILVLLL